jgi:aerobic carbon-monoxide dehydrogenase medium subunit
MKPAPFEYHAPRSVDEAVKLLGEFALEDGRILAGGQSLVPTMAYRMATPAHLVDINRIEDGSGLRIDGNVLSIGCLTRHAAFEKPVIANPLGHLLSTVCEHIAHYPIRRRGTFCGSLAHADPASEWCLVAATLNAEIDARSVDGERRIAAADFFEGIMTTALSEKELLVAVRLPLLGDNERFGFFEFSRRAGDFGLTMALVVYRIDNGKIVDPRVGLGGVEDRPSRNAAAEALLMGAELSDAVFAAAADAAASSVEPMEDIHAPASYRRHLVKNGVLSALRQTVS